MNKMKKLNEIIEKFFKELMFRFANIPEIEAVIVAGSASRKEETYIFNKEKLLLFSDIDFNIITNKKISETIFINISNIVNETFNYLKPQYFSNFSKVDFSIYPLFKLPFLDKRFIHFETKESRVVFGNAKVLDKFPNINLKNLNYAELLTIPVHRAFSVCNYLNSQYDFVKVYGICRNMLDILTVILPFEGYLVPTYKKRLEVFSKIHKTNKRLQKFFNTNELLDILEKCFELKISTIRIEEKINVDIFGLVEKFLEILSCLEKYLENALNGKLFLLDKRDITRNIIKFNPLGIFQALEKPKKLKHFYFECKEFTKQTLYEFDLEKFKKLKEDYHSLFNL